MRVEEARKAAEALYAGELPKPRQSLETRLKHWECDGQESLFGDEPEG